MRLEWDVTGNTRWFYLKLQQFDTALFGSTTRYDISVAKDVTPPQAPRNPRCEAVDATTLNVQWQQSGERDVVRYIVNWRREDYQQGGAPDVEGRESTYTQLTGLTPGKLYYMRIQAQDFSGNLSSESSQVFCIAAAPEDSTNPTITLEQPTMGTAYTTSAPAVTFSGIAQDTGGSHLSRVKVTNSSNGVTGWDYTLSGDSDAFHVADITLAEGISNNIQVVVYDGADNTGVRNVIVTRTGLSLGAVIIMGGRNETLTICRVISTT